MKILRRGKQQRRIVVALSDLHSGHQLGLLNPDVILVQTQDDGSWTEWTPEQTENQRYLWALYLEFMEGVKALAGDDEIILLHLGDLIHGVHYRDGLIPDTSLVDQRAIAEHNLLPWMLLPNVRRVRLLTGTGIHVRAEGSNEARMAYSLSQVFKGKDIQATHHSRLEVDGFVFDAAHHGPPGGSRDWLRGNVARYYLRDRMQIDRRGGLKPPFAYLRGHFHVDIWETLREQWRGELETSHLIVVPSFMGLTWHGRKVTRSEPVVSNGLYAFEIGEGQCRIHPFTRKRDQRAQESL